MASLTGQTISSTYDSLLKVSDNGPITSSPKTITDGLGNSSSLQLSTVSALFSGTIVGQSSIDIAGTIYQRDDIAVLNKLGNSWLHWATRNIAGSDAVINLSNIGTLTLNSTISNGTYTYTLPGATGTLALVGGAGVGTVTSVAALTLGTSGTDLSSSVANSTTTPVITLNVPTASASNRGALSSADWTTFNNKQSALTNPVTGTGTSGYVPKFTGSSTIGNSLIFDNNTVVLIGATTSSGDIQTKLELINNGPVGLKIKSLAGNGNNTFLSIESSKEWRFVTNRGDLISGNQGDLIIRNNTDNINHIILNQSGATTFYGALTGTTATFNGSTININSDNTYVIPNRSSTTWDAATVYRTAGVNNWLTGLRGGVTGYTIRNLSTGVDAILVDYITNAITLGGALTGTSASFSGNGAFGTTSGNLEVGYGATQGLYKLDVNGTGRFSNTVSIVANSSAQNLLIQGRSSDNFGQVLFYSNDGLTRYGYLQGGSTYGGTVALVGDGGGRIDLDNRGITLNQALTGTSATFSGNIGIGTTSPYANLDLGASGTNNIILRNTASAYQLSYIGTSSTGINIGFSNSNGSLVPLPYLTVTTNGRVLIGNPPPTESTFALDVNGTGRFSGALTGTSATFSGNLTTNSGVNYFNGASESVSYYQISGVTGGHVYLTSTKLELNAYGSRSLLFETNGSTRLTIASTGAATFSGTLGINGTADNVNSGTYTPTLTNVTNVSSSTAYKSFYTRLGNIVTVMGSIVVTPTSTGNTRIDISLPIASALANNQDLAGQSTGLSGVASDGAIIADATNDRAQCLYIADAASGQTLMYSFSYEIK